jgi:hypothetical protein
VAREVLRNDEHEFAVGHGAQQAFDQCGTEEAGRPGDRDAFAGEALANHEFVT